MSTDKQHGGTRKGAGRKPMPLELIKTKRSFTLSLIAIQALEEQRLPNESASAALDRILISLPVLALDAASI